MLHKTDMQHNSKLSIYWSLFLMFHPYLCGINLNKNAFADGNPLHRVISSSGISVTGSVSGTSRYGSNGNAGRNIYTRGSQVRSIPSVTSLDWELDDPVGADFDEMLDVQNTVFNHIDWSEFLAPGKCPPPPTHVPEGDLR